MSWLSGLLKGISSGSGWIKNLLPQIGRVVKVVGDVAKPFNDMMGSDSQDGSEMAETFIKSAARNIPKALSGVKRLLKKHQAPSLANNMNARARKQPKLNEESEEIPEMGFTGKERYDFEGS